MFSTRWGRSFAIISVPIQVSIISAATAVVELNACLFVPRFFMSVGWCVQERGQVQARFNEGGRGPEMLAMFGRLVRVPASRAFFLVA